MSIDIKWLKSYAEGLAGGNSDYGAGQKLLDIAEQIENLQQDAERYRWLRQYTVETLPVAGEMHSLDRQIDEAMTKEKT